MNERHSRILAIDDTPANLLTLGAALSEEFDVQIATSGAQGLALAAEMPPDLILLDVMMPGMDGFETCRRLKADTRLKDIPVIFVTALNDIESEIQGLGLGAVDYITKPIQVSIARQRIRNLLEREQLRRQLMAQRDQLALEVAEHARTQVTLRKLTVAIEQGPAVVVITDPDGTIQYVNPGFTAMTGYDATEVIGKNPRILQSGETSQSTYQNLWQHLEAGQAWQGELINKRKNGEHYWKESLIAPVTDASGAITHYVAVNRTSPSAWPPKRASRLQTGNTRISCRPRPSFQSFSPSAVNLDPTTPLIVTDPTIANAAPYSSNPVIRDANGNPYGISSLVGQEMRNPSAYIQTRLGNYNWADDIVGNAYLEAAVTDNIKIRSTLGAKKAFWGNISLTPVNYLSATSNALQNSYGKEENKVSNWNIENIITYDKSLDNHHFTVLLGQAAYTENAGSSVGTTLFNLPISSYKDASFNFDIPQTSRSTGTKDFIEHRVTSLFGRVNYNYGAMQPHPVLGTNPADFAAGWGSRLKLGEKRVVESIDNS